VVHYLEVLVDRMTTVVVKDALSLLIVVVDYFFYSKGEKIWNRTYLGMQKGYDL